MEAHYKSYFINYPPIFDQTFSLFFFQNVLSNYQLLANGIFPSFQQTMALFVSFQMAIYLSSFYNSSYLLSKSMAIIILNDLLGSQLIDFN